jgi:competence protein ComEC
VGLTERTEDTEIDVGHRFTQIDTDEHKIFSIFSVKTVRGPGGNGDTPDIHPSSIPDGVIESLKKCAISMSIYKKKLFFLAALSLLGLLLNSSPDAAPPPPAEGTPGEPAARTLAPTPAGSPEAGDLLKIHFIDVGHGDACLIQTPGGHTILIDGGYSDVADDVVDYIKKAGVKEIDLVIATHPHSDHVGGLTSVLTHFPVKMVLDSGKPHTSVTYQRFLKAVKAGGKIKYVLGRAGQVHRYDAVTISVLSPTEPLSKNLNNCSIVCRLVYGEISVMFTGDAEVAAEKAIMRRNLNIKSTILKVGHHGSDTSTSPTFLRAVAPKVAIISCGRRDSGNSPHAESTLKGRGVTVYRTDIDGTILVESNGEDYIVKARRQKAYPDYEIPPEHKGKIIGNWKSMIYHLPGGAYYQKVSPESRRYFATEVEAKRAGYRRSLQ